MEEISHSVCFYANTDDYNVFANQIINALSLEVNGMFG